MRPGESKQRMSQSHGILSPTGGLAFCAAIKPLPGYAVIGMNLADKSGENATVLFLLPI